MWSLVEFKTIYVSLPDCKQKGHSDGASCSLFVEGQTYSSLELWDIGLWKRDRKRKRGTWSGIGGRDRIEALNAIRMNGNRRLREIEGGGTL